MKISKSFFAKICIVTGFILFASSIFASEAIVIRKGEPVPPPEPQPFSMEMEIPVTATIDAIELAIYFEYSVGDATITVYDQSNQVVYQDTVDTDVTTNVFISSVNWTTGQYTLTISYDTTNLIGEFDME